MFADGLLNIQFIYDSVIFCVIFKQAVARGLKDPSFRVIQNHFAISGNVGEVAAKVYSHILNLELKSVISGNSILLWLNI